MKYLRTTISLPKFVWEIGQARAKAFRISFSEYLSRLVEEENRLQRKTLILFAEEESDGKIHYLAAAEEPAPAPRTTEEPVRVYHETITPAEAKRRERADRAKKKRSGK